MLLESCLPPHLDAVVRSAALFASYTTLMKFNVHPLAHSFVLVLCRSLVAFMMNKGINSNSRRSMLLNGLWSSFNITCIVFAIAKLHPFRVVVGQYAALAVSRSLGRTIGLHAAVLLLCGLVILGWANNLTPTHLSVAREDTIHVVDSIGGMIALLVYVVSEGIRVHRNIGRKPETVHRECRRTCTEVVSSIAVSAGMAIAVELLGAKGLGLSSIFVWGFSSVGDGTIMFAFPLCLWLVVMYVAGPSKSVSRQRLTEQLSVHPLHINESTVVVASFTGFVLHTFYHHHFSSSGIIESETHPMWHVDNLMVLVGAAFIAASMSASDTQQVDESDNALFDLTPGASRNTSLVALVRMNVLSRPRQRKLFIFFCMTMSFMVVELIYGLHANSLSLVSDSFHMLLDAASIGLGLWTSVMANWPRSRLYPRGYGGYETISGFINGIVLLLVATWIAWESIERLLEPPQVITDHLLAVAVGGLVVNVVGVVFFHEAHSHGHSHSHDGSGCCHSATTEQNMRGIYLHILADLLGSVAVILSTLVIHLTGWSVVDPICSILISSFIFFSALPLVQQAGSMLSYGTTTLNDAEPLFKGLETIAGVTSIDKCYLRFYSGSPVLAAVSIRVLDDANTRSVQSHCRHALEFVARDSVIVETLTKT